MIADELDFLTNEGKLKRGFRVNYKSIKKKKEY